MQAGAAAAGRARRQQRAGERSTHPHPARAGRQPWLTPTAQRRGQTTTPRRHRTGPAVGAGRQTGSQCSRRCTPGACLLRQRLSQGTGSRLRGPARPCCAVPRHDVPRRAILAPTWASARRSQRSLSARACATSASMVGYRSAALMASVRSSTFMPPLKQCRGDGRGVGWGGMGVTPPTVPPHRHWRLGARHGPARRCGCGAAHLRGCSRSRSLSPAVISACRLPATASATRTMWSAGRPRRDGEGGQAGGAWGGGWGAGRRRRRRPTGLHANTSAHASGHTGVSRPCIDLASTAGLCSSWDARYAPPGMHAAHLTRAAWRPPAQTSAAAQRRARQAAPASACLRTCKERSAHALRGQQRMRAGSPAANSGGRGPATHLAPAMPAGRTSRASSVHRALARAPPLNGVSLPLHPHPQCTTHHPPACLWRVLC